MAHLRPSKDFVFGKPCLGRLMGASWATAATAAWDRNLHRSLRLMLSRPFRGARIGEFGEFRVDFHTMLVVWYPQSIVVLLSWPIFQTQSALRDWVGIRISIAEISMFLGSVPTKFFTNTARNHRLPPQNLWFRHALRDASPTLGWKANCLVGARPLGSEMKLTWDGDDRSFV
jgi:hypothetical protein